MMDIQRKTIQENELIIAEIDSKSQTLQNLLDQINEYETKNYDLSMKLINFGLKNENKKDRSK